MTIAPSIPPPYRLFGKKDLQAIFDECYVRSQLENVWRFAGVVNGAPPVVNAVCDCKSISQRLVRPPSYEIVLCYRVKCVTCYEIPSWPIHQHFIWMGQCDNCSRISWFHADAPNPGPSLREVQSHRITST